MNQIHLKLPIEDEKIEVIIANADFNECELKLLRQYSSMTSRIRTCTLLQRGMQGFQGMTFDQNGLSIRAGTCSLPELYELLHVLRPVTLEKERASFCRVAKILEERLLNQYAFKFLQLNQHVFKHGEMSLYFQVSISDSPLFDDSLLRIWLNGTQYHTDANKAATWATLEATLGEPSAQALVMSQLHGKVISILNIDYMVQRVLAAQISDV